MRRFTVLAWWWWLGVVCGSTLINNDACGPPPCIGGCYLVDTAATMCVVTPAGTYSPDNANSLYVCEPGTFSQIGFGQCLACPPGSFSQDEGSYSCSLCPASSYSPEPGFRECLACDSALYSGWGSDRVVTFGGKGFCQRPGSTNQLLTLVPTLAPTEWPVLTTDDPIATPSLSPLASRAPQQPNRSVLPSGSLQPSRSPQPSISQGSSASLKPIISVTSIEPTTSPSQQASNNTTTLSPLPFTTSQIPSDVPSLIPFVSPAPSKVRISPTSPTGVTQPPTKQPRTSNPTTTIERNSERFRKTFFRVLPVFSAALLVMILACCIRKSKKKTPKEVVVPKQGISNEGSRGESSSMGDIYMDDDYDDVFASVELGSLGAASISVVSDKS